jgi:hypothetical protein
MCVRERERAGNMRVSVRGLDTSPPPVVGVKWGTDVVSALNRKDLIWC